VDESLKAFDRATRDVARHTAALKAATERRDQAAVDVKNAGDLTLQQLADRSTELGVRLSRARMVQIVSDTPRDRKRHP
jgi:hypothetical protein